MPRKSRSRSKSPRPYSKLKCPKGTISRRSYVYHSKKTGKSRRIKASCVKSPRSLRARGKKAKRVIPKLRSGSLTKYGFHAADSVEKRHASLRKAYKAYGRAELDRKLAAVMVLTKNTNPKASKVYKESIKYVKSLSADGCGMSMDGCGMTDGCGGY